MSRSSCDWETEVVAAAARPPGLEGRLREHASSCRECTEAASVAGFLGGLARRSYGPPAADAGDLYRRARLLERLFQEAAPVQRTLGRLALAEVLGTLVSGLALLSWAAWMGAAVWQRLPQWPGTGWMAVLAWPLAAGAMLVFGAFAASLPLLLAED